MFRLIVDSGSELVVELKTLLPPCQETLFLYGTSRGCLSGRELVKGFYFVKFIRGLFCIMDVGGFGCTTIVGCSSGSVVIVFSNAGVPSRLGYETYSGLITSLTMWGLTAREGCGIPPPCDFSVVFIFFSRKEK